MPPAPPFVFGREEVIGKLVQSVASEEATQNVILGAGGIGKTTVAVEVFRSEQCVARYGAHRHFVSCETLTTPSLLVTALCQVLQVPVGSLNRLQSLIGHLDSLPRTLIVLDNFETTWDPVGGRHEVETLLGHLNSSKSLSTLVTMRGNAPPPSVLWSDRAAAPLDVLDEPSAVALYQAYCPLAVASQELSTLLEEVGRLPLAITLLAKVASLSPSSTNPSKLLMRWERHRTALLEDGVPHRLHSVDASILVSIESETMANEPEALQLLSLLAQLPAGITSSATLDSLTPGFRNSARAADTLCRVSLAFWTNEKLKVLPPIRHFILPRYPLDSVHQRHLDACYIALCRSVPLPFDHPLSSGEVTTLDSSGALLRRIRSESANIRAVLQQCVENRCDHNVVFAILAIAEYFAIAEDDIDLLSLVVHHPTCFDTELRAWSWWILGAILLHRDSNRDPQVELVLQTAKQEFTLASVDTGVGYCELVLTHHHAVLGEIEAANLCFQNATLKLGSVSHPFAAAGLKYACGFMQMCRGRWAEAQATLAAAWTALGAHGSLLWTIACGDDLENAYQAELEETDAQVVAPTLLHVGALVSPEYGAAKHARFHAAICQSQKRNEEALSAWTLARRHYEHLQDGRMVAHCDHRAGVLCVKLQRAEDGIQFLQAAICNWMSGGRRAAAADCLYALREPFGSLNRHEDAIATVLAARII